MFIVRGHRLGTPTFSLDHWTFLKVRQEGEELHAEHNFALFVFVRLRPGGRPGERNVPLTAGGDDKLRRGGAPGHGGVGRRIMYRGVQYAAHGPVKSAVYGSTLTDTWTFDPVRLRPLELKTTAEDQSVKLDLKYWYCAGQAPGVPMACSSNNGNVQATGIMATGRPSVGEPGGGGHDLESGVNAGGPFKVQQ